MLEGHAEAIEIQWHRRYLAEGLLVNVVAVRHRCIVGHPMLIAPPRPTPLPRSQRFVISDVSEDVISVFREVTIGQGQERVEVVADGESSLTLTWSDDDVPEIGIWRHVLAPGTFNHLVRTLHATNYESLPAGLVPGFGGEVYGERRKAETSPRSKAFGRLPAEMFEVLSLLSGIRAELGAHPERVVRGEARWLGEHGGDDGTLELELRLSNIGREPLLFSNPQHGPRSGWNGLRVFLEALEQGKQADNYGQFDLTPANVQRVSLGSGAERRPVASDPAALRLEPGEGLWLTGRIRVSGDAGAYSTRLMVCNMISSGDSEYASSVPGTLWLRPGRVNVAEGAGRNEPD